MADDKQTLENLRILVAEDEYLLAAELSSALRNAGATVVGPARDVPHALELVQHDAPDCAIVDMNLAGELGLPLTDALETAAVPYIILSGYDRAALPLRHDRAPYVEKPADPSVLVRMIPALLRGAGAPTG